MATLADLKTRISTEMVRRDLLSTLAPQLLLHIQRACEYYADQRFWFNAIVTAANAAPGVADLALPATVRRVERLALPAHNAALHEVQLGQMDTLSGTGAPRFYAALGDALRLSPTPDAAYSLQITGLAQIPAPVADADASAWTNEAQDLICYRTQETLFRHQFVDRERANDARLAALEALQRLKRETARRLQTPLRSERGSAAFNIING